jgi:CheY-like chemotaxis protein
MVPMTEIQCLYLEDNPQDRDSYKDLIELAWRKHSPHITIKITTVDSTDKAIRELQSNPGKYHLLIADLLFGPNDEERGVIAIEAARQLDSDIAILAFSMGDKYQLAETAKAKGADDFYLKTSMTKREAPGEDLGAKLVRILTKHGREPIAATPIPPHLYRKNLPLAAIIETVTPLNISNLVFKILGKPCKTVTPFFVKPGLSGAFVLGVECDLEAETERPSDLRNLLLKISKDVAQLRSEFSKREQAKAFGTLFVPFYEAVELPSSGGWYAIAADHLKSLTLLDWLIQTDERIEADTITRSLRTLFLGSKLKTVYAGYRRREDLAPNVRIWEELHSSRRARIQLSCRELAGLANKYDPAGDFNAKLIEGFISEAKKVDSLNGSDIQDGVSICRCHGDLHGRNILIDENDNPSLIDPANIEDLHWASDIARLTVDLIVSGLDAGDLSHEWERMSEWVNLSKAFVSNQIQPFTGDMGHPNARIHVALHWIRENLNEIHAGRDGKQQDKPEWEFRLALAIEFMRATYRRQDLPTPKRVLGLLAACLSLREACKSYKESLALS